MKQSVYGIFEVFADTFNGLMAIPNFVALFALSGVVAKLTKAYFGTKTDLRKQ